MSPRQVSVGDALPSLEVRLTRADVVRYAGASTDFNPIHFSDDHARAIGLEGVVVHGMWTMGAALAGVVEWAGGPDSLVEYGVRFTRPIAVPPGDEGTVVVFAASVTAVEDGLASVTIEATHEGQKVLGRAVAKVRL